MQEGVLRVPHRPRRTQALRLLREVVGFLDKQGFDPGEGGGGSLKGRKRSLKVMERALAAAGGAFGSRFPVHDAD